MVTRIGSIDFGTKLKFAHESLMPGFVPFYKADLLKSSMVMALSKEYKSYPKALNDL